MTQKLQIIQALTECTPTQITMFMRMYSPNDLIAEVTGVVNSLPANKVAHTLRQVLRTVEINKKPKPEPVKPPPEVKPPTIEERILPVALEVADDSFNETKMSSDRRTVGGGEQIDFTFEGKTYMVSWEGFWEKADYYEYSITGHEVNFSGTQYLD